MKIHPDLTESKRFLSKLDPTADNFVFQVFDDNGARKDPRLARVIPGALDAVADQLIKYQKAGAGVFVTINRSRNGGRTKKDIIAPRAVFREADEPNLPELPIKPQLIVESSPGKQHEYLLLDNNCNDLDTWKAVMMTMVTVHGSDPNAKDIARVLRLPGFYHQKDPNHPHMVKITHENGSGRYSMAEIAKVIPPSKKQKNRNTALAVSSNIYAQKALANELAELSGTARGSRNHQLNKAAFSMGQLIAAGALDHGQVETALLSAAAGIGLWENEAIRTIKSGFESGMKNPRTVPEKGLKAEQVAQGREYHLTELGNAERFADQHGQVVRYVTEWKKWIFWNEKKWETGANEKVRQLAHKTVRGFYDLAAGADTTEKAEKLGKWAVSSSRSAAISAMLKEAASLLFISPNELDIDPWLFNCNNCTINLKTGEVQKHKRQDFITKITPVDFRPDAKAPIFEKVLGECLAQNQETIEFVQRYFGYSTSGSTKEQCFAIFYGSGANGKTTIITPISEALGDYAQTTRPETLMVKRSGSIPSDLAKLKGVRLVTAAEAEDGHRLAESQIKLMTGGEKIQARSMYQDFFEYTPEFKIVLCTNHKPVIRGQDHAIWRRIRLVPFTVTIPEEKQDKDLPEKLQKELPGILTWIITGAAMWLTDGLGNSEEIQKATEKYRGEQNIIDNFLEGQCTVKDTAFVEAGILFKIFDEWRQNEGQRKITQTKFGRMLGDLGFEKSRNSVTGRTIYRGIGLNQDQTLQDLQNPSGKKANENKNFS